MISQGHLHGSEDSCLIFSLGRGDQAERQRSGLSVRCLRSKVFLHAAAWKGSTLVSARLYSSTRAPVVSIFSLEVGDESVL